MRKLSLCAISFAFILMSCTTPQPAASGKQAIAETQNQVPAQCYWLSNSGEGWVGWDYAPTAESCFELDSCSGGEGLSGGGCYKWATAPDAPAIAWPAPPPPPAPKPHKTPPLTDGLYAVKGACPFEGCQLGRWLSYEAVALRSRPDPAAPVVTTIAPQAWVNAIDSVDYVRPIRGLIIRDQTPYARGDVIYQLGYEGEGFVSVWHRGKEEWGFDPSDSSLVQWDPQSQQSDPRTGWWVEIETRGGQRGWTRELPFDCMGAIDPPPVCNEAPR